MGMARLVAAVFGAVYIAAGLAGFILETPLFGLFDVNPAHRSAWLGYAVAPAWRGRGVATRATWLLSRWALTEAGLGRLMAGTAPDNAASQRVLAKTGFVREGTHRGYLPAPHSAKGARDDLVAHALLASDL